MGGAVMAGAKAQAAAGSSAAASIEPDPRCPSVELKDGTMLPSCCDPNNQCGINPAKFGTAFCLDLAIAADQGAAFGFDRSQYPTPRACDAD